jgi:hypothetical protein
MTIVSGFRVTKALALLRRRIKPDRNFDVAWEQTGHVDSERFPPANRSEIKLYRVLHLIAGEASITTSLGTKMELRVLGTVDLISHEVSRWRSW